MEWVCKHKRRHADMQNNTRGIRTLDRSVRAAIAIRTSEQSPVIRRNERCLLFIVFVRESSFFGDVT
jgi:hypothetical protein